MASPRVVRLYKEIKVKKTHHSLAGYMPLMIQMHIPRPDDLPLEERAIPLDIFTLGGLGQQALCYRIDGQESLTASVIPKGTVNSKATFQPLLQQYISQVKPSPGMRIEVYASYLDPVPCYVAQYVKVEGEVFQATGKEQFVMTI